jgi:hypothetical protein
MLMPLLPRKLSDTAHLTKLYVSLSQCTYSSVGALLGK